MSIYAIKDSDGEDNYFCSFYPTIKYKDIEAMRRISFSQDRVTASLGEGGAAVFDGFDISNLIISNDDERKNFYETVSIESFLRQKNTAISDERVANVVNYSIAICKGLGVSESAFLDTIIMAVLFFLKGENLQANAILKAAMSQLVGGYLLSSHSKLIGRSGGRPEHHLKNEAIKIAHKRWQDLPSDSMDSVVNYVYNQLSKERTDQPSIASIKRWIKNTDFRPRRKPSNDYKE